MTPSPASATAVAAAATMDLSASLLANPDLLEEFTKRAQQREAQREEQRQLDKELADLKKHEEEVEQRKRAIHTRRQQLHPL
jgi:cell shape-determining protein MreC